jgi:zinc protease
MTVRKLIDGLTYYIAPTKSRKRAGAATGGQCRVGSRRRPAARPGAHRRVHGLQRHGAFQQELVRYLESIGMRFGADLNAYTSFDETVYMLTVPTDAGKALEQSVQILEDWRTACRSMQKKSTRARRRR